MRRRRPTAVYSVLDEDELLALDVFDVRACEPLGQGMSQEPFAAPVAGGGRPVFEANAVGDEGSEVVGPTWPAELEVAPVRAKTRLPLAVVVAVAIALVASSAALLVAHFVVRRAPRARGTVVIAPRIASGGARERRASRAARRVGSRELRRERPHVRTQAPVPARRVFLSARGTVVHVVMRAAPPVSEFGFER